MNRFPGEGRTIFLKKMGKKADDDFALDEDDDFASVDQRTDKNELKGDVGTLQTQQEALDKQST